MLGLRNSRAKERSGYGTLGLRNARVKERYTVAKKVPAERHIGRKVLLFRSLVGVMFQFLAYN